MLFGFVAAVVHFNRKPTLAVAICRRLAATGHFRTAAAAARRRWVCTAVIWRRTELHTTALETLPPAAAVAAAAAATLTPGLLDAIVDVGLESSPPPPPPPPRRRDEEEGVEGTPGDGVR